MTLDEDPAGENRPDPQFQQTAVSNVQARDIQIGQIVQKIVYLGILPNSPLRPFALVISIALYLTLLIVGFYLLWQEGSGFVPLLLLIAGSGLLSLTCLYYAKFWKPEIQDRSQLIPEGSLDNEQVERQRTKQRSRQQIRRLAIVGVFIIPLLTFAGFFGWRSLPPPKILVLVANFDGPNQQNYQVTETLLRNLRNATEAYTDVKVQALNQTITEQQGSDVARSEGEQRKAAIVIWGEYGVTPTDVQISIHYELLKPLEYFPELGEEVDGKAQTLAIAELNSFKLQTRLSNEMNYLTLFTLGMVQYAEGDWESAVARFSDALDQVKEPVPVLDQTIVYFYRGTSYLSMRDNKSAIADYNQAIKLKPDDAEAYNKSAIADYTQALKLKSDLVEAYNNRGNAYINLSNIDKNPSNIDKAIEDYREAIKIDPNLAEAHNNLGTAYSIQGDFLKAIKHLGEAIKLRKDNAEAYTNRGNAYKKQGNIPQAIEDYKEAIKINPKLSEAYNGRGIAYTDHNNYTAALIDFNKAIDLKPDSAEAYNSRGNFYAKQGKSRQAIDDYTDAIAFNKNLVEAYSNRGLAYVSEGNYLQAFADYKKAIELDPNYAGAYNSRGNAYVDQDKYPQAIADYNEAIKLNKNLSEAYFGRGNAYYKQKDYKRAIAEYTQAIKLKGDFVDYYYRGNAYAAQKDYDRAIADFTQTLKLNPKYAGAYYNKAWIYSLKKEVKAAIENLQQAIDLDAKYREMAKTDSDFDNIRKDEQFQALVGK